MKSVWMFLSGLVAGLILMGTAYQYHFVLSDEGFVVISKPQATLSDVYADIRGWTLQDWTEHSELAKALIADGRGNLVGGSMIDGTLDKLLPSSSGDALKNPRSASDLSGTLHR
ncbi:MAG TPA: hypothetical protein VMM56_05525 [Planctomycetaceae bacterium]|nr:hypothetical protein [Planctomycetaceae bacterium]